MPMKMLSFVLFMFFCSSMLFSQGWKSYPHVPEGSLLSFPLDEGHHADEPIEWWYTGGHLVGDSTGTLYSYMLTYFYFPDFGFDGFRIFNISNDTDGSFFRESQAVHYPVLSQTEMDLEAQVFLGEMEHWKGKKDPSGAPSPFDYELHAESEHGSLTMEYTAQKPPLVHTGTGLFDIGISRYTYYYALTDNLVTGTITLGDVTENVTGTAWIDRQYGTFDPSTGEDYEWFFVQLSNNMDITFWNIFTVDREVPQNEKYVHFSVAIDTTDQYTLYEFDIERLNYHCMPDSMRCYANQWRIQSDSNDIDLIVTALHENPEVLLPFRFFEGALDVTGTVNGQPVTGRGFAELLHGYDFPRSQFTTPASNYWDQESPIAWTSLNPDDGLPLLYDLKYRTELDAGYQVLAEGLTDTSFIWAEPQFNGADSVWLLLTAYSVDRGVVGDTFAIIDLQATSVKDLSGQEITQIYPNPAREVLNIDFARLHDQLEVQIMNTQGQLLSNRVERNLTQLAIDTHQLPDGIYLARFIAKDREFSVKFLVE